MWPSQATNRVHSTARVSFRCIVNALEAEHMSNQTFAKLGVCGLQPQGPRPGHGRPAQPLQDAHSLTRPSKNHVIDTFGYPLDYIWFVRRS